MAGKRIHVIMESELVAQIDARLGPGQSRGDWVRRAVEQALALAESGRLLPETGSRESGDARFESRTPAPAEQSQVVRAADDAIQPQRPAGMPGTSPAKSPKLSFDEVAARVPPGHEATVPVFSRVRSSAAARPFRPAPKKGS